MRKQRAKNLTTRSKKSKQTGKRRGGGRKNYKKKAKESNQNLTFLLSNYIILNKMNIGAFYKNILLSAIYENDKDWFTSKERTVCSYRTVQKFFGWLPESGEEAYQKRYYILKKFRPTLSCREIQYILSHSQQSLYAIAKTLSRPYSTIQNTFQKLRREGYI